MNMTVTDLINRLIELREEHGDLEVDVTMNGEYQSRLTLEDIGVGDSYGRRYIILGDIDA